MCMECTEHPKEDCCRYVGVLSFSRSMHSACIDQENDRTPTS